MSTTDQEYQVDALMKRYPRVAGETDVQYFARLLDMLNRGQRYP